MVTPELQNSDIFHNSVELKKKKKQFYNSKCPFSTANCDFNQQRAVLACKRFFMTFYPPNMILHGKERWSSLTSLLKSKRDPTLSSFCCQEITQSGENLKPQDPVKKRVSFLNANTVCNYLCCSADMKRQGQEKGFAFTIWDSKATMVQAVFDPHLLFFHGFVMDEALFPFKCLATVCFV